VVRVWY